MNHLNYSGTRNRRPAAPELPYRRVEGHSPLGQNPAHRALLEAEGLWPVVTAELRAVNYCYVDIHRRRRDFCAIGWQNENGGWEVRAPRFCGYIGRKGMTFIAGSDHELLIFPDMAAYLCWRYAHRNEAPSIFILNHAEFAPAAARRALRYASVIIFHEQQPVQLSRSAAAA